MRLRLRDGDHGRTGVSTGRGRWSCNAAPSQGRRSPPTESTQRSRGTTAAMRLRLRDGDHQRGGPGRAGQDGRAAMRLRLRDGDHSHWDRYSAISSMELQCGSVSGTEITWREAQECCGGRQWLQCGSVSGTEITGTPGRWCPWWRATAAMRLRLRDGDHTSTAVAPRRPNSCNAAPSQGRRSLHGPIAAPDRRMLPLQCGSVSGTEITRKPLHHKGGGGSSSLQCGSVSGTEITRVRTAETEPVWPESCNAAPSQGRRSRAS